MKIYFPKLYRNDRREEPCQVGIPFPPNCFREGMRLKILDGERELPVQTRVLSRHQDGSVRFLQARFIADLPGMGSKTLEAITEAGEQPALKGIRIETIPEEKSLLISGGPGGLEMRLKHGGDRLAESLWDGRIRYGADRFAGPFLKDGEGTVYRPRFGTWTVREAGPLVTAVRCEGSMEREDGRETGEEKPLFEAGITLYAGKPWAEISFRLINATSAPLRVSSLIFALLDPAAGPYDDSLRTQDGTERGDSVGEGSRAKGRILSEGGIRETTGVGKLPEIEREFANAPIRLCVGSSNYQTNFTLSAGETVERRVNSASLMREANEHFPEVFYGTFFADRTTREDGVCLTVYQAQQNCPKAVKSDRSGLYAMLVPPAEEEVVFESGMSREQRLLLHFHDPKEPLAALDDRSLIYQMPDQPVLQAEAYRDAGGCPDIFVPRERMLRDAEIALRNRCDAHSRAYGMMNFGDAPDMNYTRQGRGRGQLVWCNNEYDYPHACALLYMRTGERRFLDYAAAAGRHWMDVDVCHYSRDPLLQGGQWEHSRRHVLDSCMVCSHQWVEGLLDLYHLKGEDRALETALGIGENVLRLLETPAYQKSGESNARETGWALRTLTALYTETWDRKWLARAEWIVNQFAQWHGAYGAWVAPYTDNTLVHVPFMIAVAVGSLYRYYRVFPGENLKRMMISAVDDLLSECMTETGLFYYKELPSLSRQGNNTMLLEALTVGYDLTGDERYLRAGLPAFLRDIASRDRPVGEKKIMEGTVILDNESPKAFAQSFIPLSVYYKAAAEAGLLEKQP